MKADKLREVKDGHDGTWVAHPALVTLAKQIFDEHMPQPNQIDKKREDVKVTRENLLEVSLKDGVWSMTSLTNTSASKIDKELGVSVTWENLLEGTPKQCFLSKRRVE